MAKLLVKRVKGQKGARRKRLARLTKTFAAFVQETGQTVAEKLARQAREANQAAKQSFGRLRTLYYEEKARCLRRAIELSPRNFWIDEYDPQTGIVGISSRCGTRLHLPLAALVGLTVGDWPLMLARVEQWAR